MSADQRLAVNNYDVVVLDRDLPGVHGDDVCRDLVRPNRWVSQVWSSLFTPPRMRIHPSITPSKLSFSTYECTVCAWKEAGSELGRDHEWPAARRAP